MERKRYWGFTPERRQFARDRANGECEIFYPDCRRGNTGKVNHIIGSHEGQRAGVPKETITDVRQNSYLACELHTAWQESYERRNLEELSKRQMRKTWFSPFDIGIQVWRNRR